MQSLIVYAQYAVSMTYVHAISLPKIKLSYSVNIVTVNFQLRVYNPFINGVIQHVLCFYNIQSKAGHYTVARRIRRINPSHSFPSVIVAIVSHGHGFQTV